MSAMQCFDIDPSELHLPPNRLTGADPVKLHDQILRFGGRMVGMPRVLVDRGSDTAFMIYDGLTRATRVAKLLPGQTITMESIRTLAKPVGHLPTLGDTLP